LRFQQIAAAGLLGRMLLGRMLLTLVSNKVWMCKT